MHDWRGRGGGARRGAGRGGARGAAGRGGARRGAAGRGARRGAGRGGARGAGRGGARGGAPAGRGGAGRGAGRGAARRGAGRGGRRGAARGGAGRGAGGEVGDLASDLARGLDTAVGGTKHACGPYHRPGRYPAGLLSVRASGGPSYHRRERYPGIAARPSRPSGAQSIAEAHALGQGRRRRAAEPGEQPGRGWPRCRRPRAVGRRLPARPPNRSWQIRGASRTFASWRRRVSSAEASSVLISITSSVRVAGCHASRSTDPRSP
jgi:hypothetical protein